MDTHSMWQELDEIPAGLLALPPPALADALGRPTLIHLPGRRDDPLFVSVLMHGNETVGWEAVRELLQRYEPGGGNLPLPRAMSLFIGNVQAAAQGMRHLPGLPDYNRVWPGCDEPPADPPPEFHMMQTVVERMRERGVFAAVDVHNNTGLNPHYACVNLIDHRYLHLATLFGRTVVYFTHPCGVASRAMARLCPSVTLECGKVGSRHGVEHARDYLDACLHLAEHPGHPVADHDIDLFHTVAVVKLPPEVTFNFSGHEADLRFAADIDQLNFRELPAGTSLGSVRDLSSPPLVVTDEQGQDLTARYFEVDNGELRTRSPLMPSMLTRDETVIRQDCLCYVMERYPL